MSKEGRIPRRDLDLETFNNLNRRVNAYKRQGIDPSEETIAKLAKLDDQLASKYPKWHRQFPPPQEVK